MIKLHGYVNAACCSDENCEHTFVVDHSKFVPMAVNEETEGEGHQIFDFECDVKCTECGSQNYFKLRIESVDTTITAYELITNAEFMCRITAEVSDDV